MLNLQRIIAFTFMLFAPSLSYAVIYFDDELEGVDSLFYYEPNFTSGAFTFDTAVKFSGAGSIRLNYPAICQTLTTNNQCGGSLSESFPLTNDLYERAYFRMSGTGPDPTISGLFETGAAATKMQKFQSDILGGLFARGWMVMPYRGKNGVMSLENVPTTGAATNVPTSFTFGDNRWYCIEMRQKMNTPGENDGIIQVWIDGTQVALRTDINWRRAGSNVQWSNVSLFRQIGAGNIWFDRFAVGNTRIGCIGNPPPVDTTRPTPPTNFTAQ